MKAHVSLEFVLLWKAQKTLRQKVFQALNQTPEELPYCQHFISGLQLLSYKVGMVLVGHFLPWTERGLHFRKEDGIMASPDQPMGDSDVSRVYLGLRYVCDTAFIPP